MIEFVGEGLAGLVEWGFPELAQCFPRRRDIPPRRGEALTPIRAVELSGQDLRPDDLAMSFVVTVPEGARLRVEEFWRFGGNSIWVQPIDPAFVERLEVNLRSVVRAYGCLLEIPPGLLQSEFRFCRDPGEPVTSTP